MELNDTVRMRELTRVDVAIAEVASAFMRWVLPEGKIIVKIEYDENRNPDWELFHLVISVADYWNQANQKRQEAHHLIVSIIQTPYVIWGNSTYDYQVDNVDLLFRQWPIIYDKP